MLTQNRSKRQASGARNTSTDPKRVAQQAKHSTLPTIGERRVTTAKVRGGLHKNKLLGIDSINVFDPATKKTSTATLKTVVENNANRHYVRRNVLTKGAVVETSVGKVRITNRPGQEGCSNGVKLA